MKLSKTDFLIYRDCAHNAWLKMHKPEVYRTTPLSVFEQSVMETGNDVDALARDLSPGWRIGCAWRCGEHSEASRRVRTACDILVWNAVANVYDLYEVKSSTNGDNKKAKEKSYIHDLAFQAEVLRENRVPIGRLYLLYQPVFETGRYTGGGSGKSG